MKQERKVNIELKEKLKGNGNTERSNIITIIRGWGKSFVDVLKEPTHVEHSTWRNRRRPL